jgi:DNA-binding CsgD family transcriptional regulator
VTEGIVSARRSHGASRHATRQNRPDVLTARELEVAAFTASALINRDTATATVITEEDG